VYRKIKQIKQNPTIQKILNNITWLFFDKILKLGIGVFVIAMLSRYLKPEQFGLLNYVTSIVSLFVALSALGLNAIVVRDLIEKPNKPETLGTSFFLKLGGAIVALIALIITIYILRPDDELSKYLVIILSFSLLFKTSDVIKFWYESKTKSKKIVIVENVVFISMAFVKFALIYYEAPLVGFIYVLLLESILVFVFLFLLYLKDENKLSEWRITFVRSKELLKDSWPLIISSTAWIIYSKTDQIMIGQILGNKEVGYYAAATQLSQISSFIPSVIAFSIIPSILKFKESNRLLYNNRFQFIYNFITAILFLLAIIVNFIAPELIEVLYGAEYLPATRILKIHFWIVIFIGLAVVSGRYLVNDNLQKITMKRHVLGVLINIPLNYLFIVKYGVVGAAWASLFTLITVNYFFDAFQTKTRLIFKQKTIAIFFVWIWGGATIKKSK